MAAICMLRMGSVKVIGRHLKGSDKFRDGRDRLQVVHSKRRDVRGVDWSTLGKRNRCASKPPYAALWKSSIWRIQLVSGFHLGKIWATILRLGKPGKFLTRRRMPRRSGEAAQARTPRWHGSPRTHKLSASCLQTLADSSTFLRRK